MTKFISPCVQYLYLFAFAVFLASSKTAFAQNLEERNARLTSLTSEREKFYQTLAEEWAPELYADGEIQQVEITDEKNEKHLVDVLNPADAIVSPYFDGDDDWSNNPTSILPGLRPRGWRDYLRV